MYVYEFLFRGRSNGDTAWHVVLAEEVAGSNGKSAHIEHGPLTPAGAEALGFPLSTIVAEINAASLIARDTAVAEKAVVEAERDVALMRVAELLAEKELK